VPVALAWAVAVPELDRSRQAAAAPTDGQRILTTEFPLDAKHARDLIELGIERTSDKYRYPKAIKALKRLRDDCQRAGGEAAFTTYLDELRNRQRRTTSFIAKLEAAFAPAAD